MKPTEAAALLTVAAAYDNRKPDADQAKAWAMALDDLRFEDCRDAIVNHYRAGTEWLMPGHIRAEVKRIRSKRINEAPNLTPPPDLSPIETNAWLLEARRRVADGERAEDVSHHSELVSRNLPELRALIERRPTKPEPEPLLDESDRSREPETNDDDSTDQTQGDAA